MSLHHPPLADAPSNPSGEKLGPVRWLYRIGTIAAVLVAITLVGVTLQALRHEPLLREQFAGQLGGHLARLALAVAFGLLAVAVIWRARPTEPTLLFAVSAAFVAWLYGYAFFAGALAWTQRQESNRGQTTVSCYTRCCQTLRLRHHAPSRPTQATACSAAHHSAWQQPATLFLRR
jgi:hypothetical protein